MNLRLVDRGTTSLRGASQPAGAVSGVATESHQAKVIHDAARLGDARILQSTFDAARRVSRYWTERATSRGDGGPTLTPSGVVASAPLDAFRIQAPQQEETSV